jgi:predicted nucleic acid-binding protein
MTVTDAIAGITRAGLDSVLFIYFVEANAAFLPRVDPIFAAVEHGQLVGITSVVTLCETLTVPFRDGDGHLVNRYRDFVAKSEGIAVHNVNEDISIIAARLRAAHKLRTPDAIQVATAIVSGCDAFITNDKDLKRVTEIPVIVLHELDA